MIKLYTERLLIRDYCLNDLEPHHRLISDDVTMYYLQDIKTVTIEESLANLQEAINENTNPNRTKYFFCITDKTTHKHIGSVGYTVTDFTPVGEFVGLGYFIHRDYWGKGYTTEAVKRVIQFAFTENDVYRISTGCIKENTASEKVMIKCGMIKEAEFKHYVWHDGRLKDRVEYRLLKDEWSELNNVIFEK